MPRNRLGKSFYGKVEGGGAPGIRHPTSKETKFSCAISQQEGKRRGASPRTDVPLASPSFITAPPQPPAPPRLTRSQPHWLPCFLWTMPLPTSGPLHLLLEELPSCPSPKPPLLLLHLITCFLEFQVSSCITALLPTTVKSLGSGMSSV